MRRSGGFAARGRALERKMSAPLLCRSVLSQPVKAVRSKEPVSCTPTLDTLSSCLCSPPVRAAAARQRDQAGAAAGGLTDVQEGGVHLADASQVESADVEHLRERHHAEARLEHLGGRVDGCEAGAHGGQLHRRHQVRLVQQHAVRKRQLLHGLILHALRLGLVQVQRHVLGVYDGENGI